MSGAATKRTDSLILAWVKYEKQLRRLFCFLVFQHPGITKTQIERVVTDLAENRKVNARTFIRGIGALGVKPVPELIGGQYATLGNEIERIRKTRNKLAHGQVTGNKLDSPALERDVHWIIEWVAALAVGANAEFGYDGLGRNTFRTAKRMEAVIKRYPFTPETFASWLRDLSNPQGPP